MIVVYTTVFGTTDALQDPSPLAMTFGVRFVCFTDQPIRSRAWEIRRLPPQAAPKRACRRLKQLSHEAFPEAGVTLWMDASFRLQADPHAIARIHRGDLTAFCHPRRTRIRDEAQAIIRSGKALPEAVLAQLAAYQADGWDTDERPQQVIHNGGFLLRRHTPAVIAFNEAWHREVQNWTLRDQMSLDYVAWRQGLRVDDFPGSVRSNPYARHVVMPGKPTNDF